MYSFEYSIELNEHGRPVIEPSKKTDKELDFLEHKFMAFEIVRVILNQTIEVKTVPTKDLERMKFILTEVEKMSDVFALTIKNQTELLNNAQTLLNPLQYDMEIGTIEELHRLNYNGIIYGDKILTRKEGLRVMVMTENKVYELKGGIDNEHWFN
jgi:hypothetical protein